jgi:oligoribonuclease (3'-5' exoribonuclease)
MAYYAPRYIAIDDETTGLDPHAPGAQILEIGCKILDAKSLDTIAQANWVIRLTSDPATWDKYVRDMHTANGLLAECQGPGAVSIDAANQELARFAEHYAPKAPLFGNSVGFDKGWHAVHASAVLRVAKHRVVDVSSIAIELAAQGFGEPPFLDGPHRSIPDLDRSVHIAKWARGCRAQ